MTWPVKSTALASALVAGLLVILGHPAAGQATSSQSGVSAFPIPGSLVATPQAQIAFRGVLASQLEAASIQVSGSITGVHSGVIKPDSDGLGGSFIPSTPFRAGETVTVTTSLNVLGATGGTFRFTVATPAGRVPYHKRLSVPRVRGDVWRFRSRPDLAPAAARLLSRSRLAGNDDIFLAAQFGPVQDGPEILDSSGRLVWFERVAAGHVASDFRVQSYLGRPVLTWWQGYTNAGVGVGEDVIYDSSYRPVGVVQAGNGLSADLHEFQLTPAGTALITAYYPVYWDASSVRGSKHEIVLDSVVQEIDVPTGLVLFQWDSLDHVPVGDSYAPLPLQGGKHARRNPLDYFHVNSVARDDDGNLVVSARNTWAAYKIDHGTGAVLWTLGGKHSSFRMGPGTAFAFQHDVRIRAPGDSFVTVFDDGAGPPSVHPQSRGLELTLSVERRTATLARQWEHAPSLLADYQGNIQQLPGFDDFIGWGQQPYFTEYDQRGRLILDGRFVGDTSSYRAYRFPWTAAPAAPPAVVASSTGKTTAVYASWDGATTASSWRLLSGASATTLRAARTVPKTGFETAIETGPARYVRVEALDSRGRTLAESATVPVR
jgi:hypothetical protein